MPMMRIFPSGQPLALSILAVRHVTVAKWESTHLDLPGLSHHLSAVLYEWEY